MVTGSFDFPEEEEEEKPRQTVFSASYAITSSYCYCPASPFYSPPGLNPLAEAPKTKFHEYFEKLGYTISWDYSSRLGERWYELYEDDELVAQIDMGIDLECIKEDMCQFHLGFSGTSDSPDYKVCGRGPKFDRLLEKVYQDCQCESSLQATEQRS